MRRYAIACAVAVTIFGIAEASAEMSAYTLPGNEVYPEGVAFDAASNTFYVGSTTDGAIYRGEIGKPEAAVFVPGGSVAGLTTALGMKLDPHGRLWVAGGRSGKIHVLDAVTGKAIKSFDLPDAKASLINDVAITGDAAYFTDSLTPTLWRITTTASGVGELEPWLDFNGTALAYQSGEGRAGVNLNGITPTADGNGLIVVQMNKGKLFHIDIATKGVREIPVADGDLQFGDGLVLDGATLFVVRIGANEIATVDLAPDLSGGKVTARFTAPVLDNPATAALAGDRLLVVNTQFSKRSSKSPVLPFQLLSYPVAELTSAGAR